jgi:hypothetical protein
MEYNSTVFFTLDDFNFNYKIITLSDFEEIDNNLEELFPNHLLFSPSDDVVLSLFEKINEQTN